MKKLLLILLSVFLPLFSACATQAKSDMSGYEGFADENHVFYDMSVREAAEQMEKGKTFVIYFGFAKCPWCIDAVPVLNEEAKKAGMKVAYADTRRDPSWQSNLDLEDYDLLVEILGDYFEYDDNGIKHLYTPHVFFIKDGKVVSEHSGTVEGHVAYEREMTPQELEELREAYRKGFELLG